jgi:serine/threonine protein kinase
LKIQSVPSIVDTDNDNSAIVLQPIAQPFAAFRCRGEKGQFLCEHVHKFVDVLWRVHKLGLVHRDVKFGNVFRLDNGDVLLNDWGSACNVSQPIRRYEGVIREASDHILKFLLDDMQWHVQFTWISIATKCFYQMMLRRRACNRFNGIGKVVTHHGQGYLS